MLFTKGKKCLIENSGGILYEDFTCLYPKTLPFYAQYEIDYDSPAGRNWMREHNWIPITSVVVYLILITWGKAAMESRKSWNLRTLLAIWNFSLSLFSFIGVIRTLPQLIHNLLNNSLEEVFCEDPEAAYGSGSTGFWVQLFVFSKFPELLDTFFIIIHKKPLILLHWYHHVTVLLYCWFSYASSTPTGLFFVVMNYAVHASMYGYYFLMSIHMKPKWLKGSYITSAQIVQMMGGVLVTILSFYYYGKHQGDRRSCFIQKENNVAAFLMYGSYLCLFLQFFVKRYLNKKSPTKPKANEKKLD